jgi:hypothetical protein
LPLGDQGCRRFDPAFTLSPLPAALSPPTFLAFLGHKKRGAHPKKVPDHPKKVFFSEFARFAILDLNLTS